MDNYNDYVNDYMNSYNCPDCNEAKLQSDKNARKINEVIDQVNALIQVNNETVDFIEERANEKVTEIAEVKVNEVLGDLRTEVDNIHTTLNNIAYNYILKSGEIILPYDFPTIPFRIFKKDGRFYHNATINNQFDWGDAIEIFIGNNSNSGKPGTDINYPITLAGFGANYSSGKYGENKKFILTITEEILHQKNVLNITDVSILFKPHNTLKKCFFGRNKKIIKDDINFDSGIYSATVTSTTISDILDYGTVDVYGSFIPYQKVTSLSECQSKKGTFYHDTVNLKIYINYIYGKSDIIINYETKLLNVNIQSDNKCIMFENLFFTKDSISLNCSYPSSSLYFFNCSFYRGKNDCVSFNGKYKCFLFDCMASYASKDCFNYHATSNNSLAVEINCIGYNAGVKKLEGGNTTQHSNNCSTAHDGMNILRVGCSYWNGEGPIVADVNNCYSISIGCEVGTVLPTTTSSIKSCFYFYNTDNTLRPTIVPKYVIDCITTRNKFTEYGVHGEEGTTIIGLRGNIKNNNCKIVGSWEDVVLS